MATTKRKRTQSSKAAANASPDAAAAVSNTAPKKTSKRQPPPKHSKHQPIPPTETVDIPLSPPTSGQPLKTPTEPLLPLESFEYSVLQTAITTSGACIWSKRVGLFPNGLCSAASIERDIIAGIKGNLGVEQ